MSAGGVGVRSTRWFPTLFLNVYHRGHVGGVWQLMPPREEEESVKCIGARSRRRAESLWATAAARVRGRDAEAGGWHVGSASQLESVLQHCCSRGPLARRRSLLALDPTFLPAMTSLIANIILPVFALLTHIAPCSLSSFCLSVSL